MVNSQMSNKTLCDECGKETDNCVREKTDFCSALYQCEDCFKLSQSSQVVDQRIQINKRAAEVIKKMLPTKYHSIETDYQEMLEKYEDKNIFIYGDVGRGKTVFMSSMLKRCAHAGLDVMWLSYTSFIMKLQNCFAKENKGETAYDEAQRIARFNGVLFIDDLGAEKLTDFVRQITYYILNEREQWMGRIVITSNFSLDEIDTLIDRRVSSRICGMCEIVSFSRGKDRRKEKP